MYTWFFNGHFVALFIVLGALSASAGEGGNEAYQRGVTHLANGRFEEAVACLDEFLTVDATNKPAYRCRAFAHLLRGDPESAIEDFTKAFSHDRTDAALFYGRGSAYRLLRDKERACADFSDAIRLDGEYAAPYGARACVTDFASSFKDLADFERLSARLPVDSDESPFEGLRQLTTARRVDLGSCLEYLCWEFIYDEYSLRDLAAMEATPQKAADTPAYRKLASQYLMNRQLDECLRLLDQTLRLAPANQAAYKLRGVVHILRRDLPAGIADLARAVELDPMDNTSSLLHARAKYDSAIRAMQKTLHANGQRTLDLLLRALKERPRDVDKILHIMKQLKSEAEATTSPNR